MFIPTDEIIQTVRMIQQEHLDIRTVTMGINLLSCARGDVDATCALVYEKITSSAARLVEVCCGIETELGIPIVNKRVAVTPVSLIAPADPEGCVKLAVTLEKAASAVGINFLGGYSALVHKGTTPSERALIGSIPEALLNTSKICSSVNVGTTKAGINMDAVRDMGKVIKRAAELSAASGGSSCARLVVLCNAPEDNPFMAGAFHGIGEPDCVINVGVSGPGAVKCAIEQVRGCDFTVLAETVKKTAFKITRAGQLVAGLASARLGVPSGIVDLSLAPTPAVGDSVARIIEEMGVGRCGAPGTTAALALLNDAVKKGGLMASSHVGGLSGAFIPVSEDEGMIDAVRKGSLCIEKAHTISAIIADEAAIGMVNSKTTAVRIIPAPGKDVGDTVEFGGLLGSGPVMSVRQYDGNGSSRLFIERGGRIPAPMQSLKN